MSVKINFKIYQGSTFRETLRWETSTKVYKPISLITSAAPTVITAAGHGIPVGWRFKVTNVLGMADINTTEAVYTASSISTDNVTINALNSIAFKPYVSGGILEYNQPVDLAGLTARMQIRSKLEDSVVIHELTTENGGIIINNTLKTIELSIPASITSTFVFTNAVYSLEIINGIEISTFAGGSLSLVKEVTR